jgi:hypothetical protein
LAVFVLTLSLLGGVSLGVRSYRSQAAHKRMVAKLQRLNARVETFGYQDPSRSRIQIPIIREILTHHSQVEMFLYDASTAEQVIDIAREHPEIKRIWVNLNVFDRSMEKKIEQRIPGMRVQFYTPGPGMR